MIDDEIIYARISRQHRNFKSAGRYFRIPPHIPEIELLNDTKIILMLYFDETRWTALSKTKLHFNFDGDHGNIPIETVGLQIHDYLYSINDKVTPREYLVLEEGRKIWVVNSQTCCGIENIILLLAENI